MLMPEIPAQELVPLRLPPRLAGLRRLAFNLYWTWHPEVRELFSRIDAGAWERYRSPVPLLHLDRDWTELLDNEGFMVDYEAVVASFDAYLANGAGHWYPGGAGATCPGPVAYFCAEYGIHETLGLYSGGLGVLAGDHCKTASDMALPFVAVGLFYRHGYFSQTIDADGHQEHAYPDFDPRRMPLQRVIGAGRRAAAGAGGAAWADGPLRGVAGGGRPRAAILLDSDVPENTPEDRPITHILYVRGREMRLYQEIVLGVGGVRALRALGIDPAAWHLNEGHSALLLVERTRELMAGGMPFEEALATVRAASVFTIHTPIAAGNERFAADLVRRLTAPLLAGVGLDVERDPGARPRARRERRRVRHDGPLPAQHVGRATPSASSTGARPTPPGTTSPAARSWPSPTGSTWPPGSGRRCGACTSSAAPTSTGSTRPARPTASGSTWTPSTTTACGPPTGTSRWSWRSTRGATCGTSSPAWARRPRRWRNCPGAGSRRPDDRLRAPLRHLQARRAALPGLERLGVLLCDRDRPVQFVFAGKAHPADRPGKQVIRDIFARSRDDRLRGRVVFLENYDMQHGPPAGAGRRRVAQHAAPAAGGLGHQRHEGRRQRRAQLSASWTAGGSRATTGDNGWAIGGRDVDPDEGAQDWAYAQALYRLLAGEIVPLYYTRGDDGLPHGSLELIAARWPPSRGASRAPACSRSTWPSSTCRPPPGR